jgi:AmiR/NasT family two-component response regulator
MSVHVIADIASKLSALRARVEKQHAITSELPSGTSIRRSEPDAIVVTADLRVVENIAALKEEMFGKLTHVRKRIFLVDQKARLLAVQAYALGATRVLTHPIGEASLLAESDKREWGHPGSEGI